MGLKDILIHLESDTSARRLEMAVQLAKSNDAHLTGMFLSGHPYIPPMPDISQLPPEYIEQQMALAKEEADDARKAFEAAANAEGLSSEWLVLNGAPVEATRMTAHYHDIVVLGQKDGEHGYDYGHWPDNIIMTCGRPVLIVPETSRGDTIGQRVVIAWDGSPQASRAVHDALPLMSAESDVSVIAVNPTDTGDHGDEPCADICRHLARHGIKAEAQAITVKDIGVADILLSRAADKSADLFVMGAYAHSRWREMVLGGVTAHMLENMTLPVLMAH